jgi:carboxylesterase type B
MDTKIPLNAMALAIFSMARDDARSSEDCLYLNVWRGGCCLCNVASICDP